MPLVEEHSRGTSFRASVTLSEAAVCQRQLHAHYQRLQLCLQGLRQPFQILRGVVGLKGRTNEMPPFKRNNRNFYLVSVKQTLLQGAVISP